MRRTQHCLCRHMTDYDKDRSVAELEPQHKQYSPSFRTGQSIFDERVVGLSRLIGLIRLMV